MSHGSHAHRIPGAVGMCATPGKIQKGKKMPGRMGGKKVTLPKTEIVDIIAEDIIAQLGELVKQESTQDNDLSKTT